MRYLLVTFVLVGLLTSGCKPTILPRQTPAPPVLSTEIRTAREAGWPVAIAGLSGFRSASHDISLHFALVNVSDRVIRHLYLTAYVRNSAGDPLLDEKTRSIYKELDYADSLRPGEVRWTEKAEIPEAFRHGEAATVHVRDLRAVFGDGTETPVIRVEGESLFAGQITNAEF